MDGKRVFNIAVVDKCLFTQGAMAALCQEIESDVLLSVVGFNTLGDFTVCSGEIMFDLVFYDILSRAEWSIDPDREILLIRQAYPLTTICIFSVVHEFMSIGGADWVIDKRIPLSHLKYTLCCALTEHPHKMSMCLSVTSKRRYQLSKWQTSVLRGYLANCHTKVIARTLNCSSRQVYDFRNGALEQITRQSCGRLSIWRCINRLNSA